MASTSKGPALARMPISSPTWPAGGQGRASRWRCSGSWCSARLTPVPGMSSASKGAALARMPISSPTWPAGGQGRASRWRWSGSWCSARLTPVPSTSSSSKGAALAGWRWSGSWCSARLTPVPSTSSSSKGAALAGWCWRWWPVPWRSTRLNGGQHLEGASAGQDADQLADVAGWWPGPGVPVALFGAVALYQAERWPAPRRGQRWPGCRSARRRGRLVARAGRPGGAVRGRGAQPG